MSNVNVRYTPKIFESDTRFTIYFYDINNHKVIKKEFKCKRNYNKAKNDAESFYKSQLEIIQSLEFQTKIKEYEKEFENTIFCKCGGKYRKDGKSKHLKTKKHQTYLSSIKASQN